MATRARDSTASGKEKRAISPSNVPNSTAGATPRRRSPNTSRINSPAPIRDFTPSQKHIPNYLKPTLSSGHDVPKQQGKKPASGASGSSSNKPSVARRRSFDPSRAQKSLNPTRRPSSTSGSMQKAIPERNLRAPREAGGKQHTLYARPVNTVRKSSIGITKIELGNSSSTIKEKVIVKPPEKVDTTNVAEVPQPETQSNDQEYSLVEAGEHAVGIGNNNEKVEAGEQAAEVRNNNEKGDKDSLLEGQEHGAKDSLPEDQQPGNVEQTEADSEDEESEIVAVESSTISQTEDAKIVAVEPSTITQPEDAKSVTVESSADSEHKDGHIVPVETSTFSEHQDGSFTVKAEQSEDESCTLEISSKQEELKEQTVNESDNINMDESVPGNPSAEVEEKVREEEAVALNKKEEASSGGEAPESEETEVQQVLVEDEEESEKVAPTAQAAQVKKDTAVSNDVIEETASKLREQRKNKVRALAGAFETVMSLQEPK